MTWVDDLSDTELAAYYEGDAVVHPSGWVVRIDTDSDDPNDLIWVGLTDADEIQRVEFQEPKNDWTEDPQ